jgi:hypothetical protein
MVRFEYGSFRTKIILKSLPEGTAKGLPAVLHRINGKLMEGYAIMRDIAYKISVSYNNLNID